MGAGRVRPRVEPVTVEKTIAPPYRLPSPRDLPYAKPKSGLLCRETALGLVSAMKKALDQETGVVEAFVLAEISGLPVLLIGPHGSGKTTLVKTLASALYLNGRPVKFKHVTVKEVHNEYSVFARPDFGALAKGQEKWIPKLIDSEFPFIDEVFRNQRIFAALNEVLEEKRFEGLPLKWIFFAAATNPPNQYYKTVDVWNFADLDRFSVIVEVEDRGFGFADKMAKGQAPGVNVKVDVDNIEQVREEIRRTKVSEEALSLAKVLVASLSVCTFEPVDGRGERYLILNKFAAIQDLKCYRCVHQRHLICSKYAVAPKRAFRSLIHLAKARAWALGREVLSEDVVWAFKYTVPGRTAVSSEASETAPTYSVLYQQMWRDLTEWYSQNYECLAEGRRGDPLAEYCHSILGRRKETLYYRVKIPSSMAERALKWMVLKNKITLEEASQILEDLRSGYAPRRPDLILRRGALYYKAGTREEAEDLCRFLEK